MKAELRVESGPGAGQVIVVDHDKFLIGREKDCHYRPDSELVSRHHCVIRQDQYTFRVRDMGSRNGTFVNGRQIQGEVVLADGDVLGMGDRTLKLVLTGSVPPGANPTPAAQPDEALRGTGFFEGNTLPAAGNPPAPAQGIEPLAQPRIPTPVVANVGAPGRAG
jgi:pSer/pThr/pTyr-binding forkhead associated (FHA) protein